jgi:hypothetical protein
MDENLSLSLFNEGSTFDVNSIGSKRICGVLNSITLEVDDIAYGNNGEDASESSIIDFFTLDINGLKVFIYPYKSVLSLGSIPEYLEEIIDKLRVADEKLVELEIRMVVRKYGRFLFAFDYDLINSLISEVKGNKVKDSGVKK